MTGGVPLHASAVVIGERGLVIRGASGAGKSSLAARLIADAALQGRFARIVGDDRVWVEARGGRLIVSGHPAIHGLIERRGIGILRVPALEQAVVTGFLDLAPDVDRMPEAGGATTECAGIRLPVLRLKQGTSTADQALLVEAWLLT